MRNLFLAVFLLMPAAAQAQPDTLEFETVHSEALRPALDFETVIASSDWFPAGSKPRDYRYGVGATEGMLGKEAFYIQPKPEADPSEAAYGTLMQMIPADAMRGKRIKLTARLKSENVPRLQLWMRVDGKRGAPPLGFYNMGDRPIRGTGDGGAMRSCWMSLPRRPIWLTDSFSRAAGDRLGRMALRSRPWVRGSRSPACRFPGDVAARAGPCAKEKGAVCTAPVLVCFRMAYRL